MDHLTKTVPVQLETGDHVHIEVIMLGGEQKVSAKIPDFKSLKQPITAICRELSSVIKEVSPKSATVEFGLEVAMESGQLTTLLVKGTGKANLKISLTW